MSKAFRKVEKTKSPPNCLRFECNTPASAEKAKQRLRDMAKRLRSSGRNLADANSNPPSTLIGE